MTASKKSVENPVVVGVPAPVVEVEPSAGPGEVVVTSPTGTRSVVPEHAVDSLIPQGYKVG